MTPEEAVTKLDSITGKSTEAAHIAADNVLRALIRTIAPEVEEAYSRLRERTGDWWYA